jgi:hypothetical protein
MIDLHKLEVEDIVIGERLPWNMLDGSGRLLLGEGYIIDQRSEAKELVERGAYIEKSLYTKLPNFTKTQTTSKPESEQFILSDESPSVLHLINLAVKRLEVLLKDIKKFPDARKSIFDIIKLVRTAIHLSEDL